MNCLLGIIRESYSEVGVFSRIYRNKIYSLLGMYIQRVV